MGKIDFTPYKLNTGNDSFNITYSTAPEENCLEFLKEFSGQNPFATIIINGVKAKTNKTLGFVNICKTSNTMNFIASKESLVEYFIPTSEIVIKD